MCLWIPCDHGEPRQALQPDPPAGEHLDVLERRIAAERLRAHLLREAPLWLIASVLGRKGGTC